MINKFVFLLSFLYIINCHSQFDDQISTPEASIFSINPAIVGHSENIQSHLLTKHLWSDLDRAPSIQQFGFHLPLNHYRIGTGVLINKSNYGLEEQLRFIGLFSYKIQLSKTKYISFGLGLGSLSFQQNLNSLHISDPTDVGLDNENKTSHFFDTEFGVYYFDKKVKTGFSIIHLNRLHLNPKRKGFLNNLKTSKSPILSYHVSYQSDWIKHSPIQSSFIVKKAFYGYSSLFYQVSSSINFKKCYQFGIINRNNSLGIITGLSLGRLIKKIKDDLILSYVPEMNLGSIYPGLLSHEISLRFNFKFHKNVEQIKDSKITITPKGD